MRAIAVLLTFSLLTVLSLAAQTQRPQRGQRSGSGSKTESRKTQAELLPSFKGKFRRYDKKLLVLTGEEDQTLEFRWNKKTQILRGKTAIKLADLKDGEALTVEAREDIDASLLAVFIHAK